MRTYLSTLLVIFTTVGLFSQVDDLTPPGIWKDMFVTTFDNSQAALVTATSTESKNYYYLLTDTLIHLDPDTSFSGYNEFISTEDLYYFLFLQTGISEFILLKNDTVKVLTNPASVNWSSAGVPLIMSDQSLFWPLKDVSSGRIHLLRVSEDGLELLDDTPYNEVGDFSKCPKGRQYTYVRDTLDIDKLVYFDLDSGYVKKNIPAYGDIVTIDNNPEEDLHSIIVNNSNATPSRIYKVNHNNFTTIAIPGGPYDQINLLFRNQSTQTSLFEILEFNGNKKLVKKVGGQWTDLTNQVPAFSSASIEKTIDGEVFLEINTIEYGNEFWNFQSYFNGDTLFNITPNIDTFQYISVINNITDFPFTAIFGGQNGTYLYNFYPQISSLFATPYDLLNPGDSAAHHITYRGHNYFSFEHYNQDSTFTYTEIFHRKTQGNPLDLITIHPDQVSFKSCFNSNSAILQEDGLDASSNKFYYYNIDTLKEFLLSPYDSAEARSFKSSENLCLLLSENKNGLGEQEFAYISSLVEDKVIDVTHPRYKQSGSTWTFRGHIISPIENIENENDARLWLFREDLNRFDERCNSDIKFLNSRQIDVTGMTKVAAKEIVIGGHVTAYPGEGFHLNYDSSVEFTPNAEIDQGAAMSILTRECNSNDK